MGRGRKRANVDKHAMIGITHGETANIVRKRSRVDRTAKQAARKQAC
jgi:hypothetical protein